MIEEHPKVHPDENIGRKNPYILRNVNTRSTRLKTLCWTPLGRYPVHRFFTSRAGCASTEQVHNHKFHVSSGLFLGSGFVHLPNQRCHQKSLYSFLPFSATRGHPSQSTHVMREPPYAVGIQIAASDPYYHLIRAALNTTHRAVPQKIPGGLQLRPRLPSVENHTRVQTSPSSSILLYATKITPSQSTHVLVKPLRCWHLNCGHRTSPNLIYAA